MQDRRDQEEADDREIDRDDRRRNRTASGEEPW